MTKNMGKFDSGARALVALVIMLLWFTGQISGTLAILLGVIAVVFLLTSFIGFCPLYKPFGISTCGKGR